MRILKRFLLMLPALLMAVASMAQVTGGAVTGTVKDSKGQALAGASVEVLHEPSGTKYKTVSAVSGKFNLPALRVGGPYKITVSYVGLKTETFTDVYIQLGEPSVVDVTLAETSAQLAEVVVSGASRKGALISKDRKGTGTNISRRLLTSLPTLNRSITDVTKLTPQAQGTSFAGQDNRAINFTLDGTIFNNSFGLAALNGGQTNSQPVSLDAVEEIQVNLSPYSLKEAGFTGASINAVTKSGTNTLHGGGFYNYRNEGLVGTKAGSGGKESIITNAFDVKQFGFSLGGALIKNKLFFFLNYENEKRTDPGSLFVADNGSNTGGATTARVKSSELDALSTFLQTKFNYNPGAYENYPFITASNKGLARIDWNINDKHKLQIRGNYMKSKRDVGISSSGAFTTRANSQSIAFQNTTYEINNDILSFIGQLNSRFSSKVANEVSFGYTANRDYRAYKGGAFPTVDILDGTGDRNYISFGVDPFTPNNRLNTDTWQFSDNLTVYSGKHTITAGVSYESFKYYNAFTPNVFGTFTFKSLADFYTSANAYLANPNMTTNPVQLRRYQYSISNLPDGGVWAAVTKAKSIGAYIQDDVELEKNFNLTYGIRFDVPYFTSSGFTNTEVDGLSFLDDKGQTVKLSTSKLPSALLQISPRVGFNYDISGNKTTQIRGGIGLFTGRPPFVYISNSVGNNGVISGSGSFDNAQTLQFPFKPNTPATVPASLQPTPLTPAASYNIAPIADNFRYPKIVRANLAVDHKLYRDIVGGVEVVFTQSINNIYYYNANLVAPVGTFAGPDQRLRYANPNALSGGVATLNTTTTAIRINPKISDATVLKSGPYGQSVAATIKIEKPLKAKGLGWLVAYNYGRARDYITGGSIAFSSWSGNRSINGNNRPDIAFSDNDNPNRVIANVNYRTELGKNAAIQFSLFSQTQNQGRITYTYTGDLNGDGVSGNDLLYVPKDQSEMNFTNLAGYTIQQQKDAFDAYINQDKYLSTRRGKYAERNGGLLPYVTRFDISVMVELFGNINKNRHTIQLRGDIFNFGNMLNSASGVGYAFNSTNVLAAKGVDANGVPVYTFNTFNSGLTYSTYRKGTSIVDTWQAQLGIRYIF